MVFRSIYNNFLELHGWDSLQVRKVSKLTNVVCKRFQESLGSATDILGIFFMSPKNCQFFEKSAPSRVNDLNCWDIVFYAKWDVFEEVSSIILLYHPTFIPIRCRLRCSKIKTSAFMLISHTICLQEGRRRQRNTIILNGVNNLLDKHFPGKQWSF